MMWRPTFGGLLLLAGIASAHNQAITVAAPVPAAGFTIDGDLSDWDRAGKSNALRVDDSGETRGNFWVAYAPDVDTLYVAAEIRDDDLVTQSPGPGIDVDSFDLFVEADHHPSPYQSAYFFYRESASAFRAVERTAARAARHIVGNTVSYEWQIDLKPLRVASTSSGAMSVIGFDVQYIDRHRDGTATTVTWSPGSHKHEDTDRVGDLMLQAGDAPLAELRGKARWRGRADLVPSHVHIRQLGNPGFLIRVPVGTDGTYRAELPRGRYEVRAWDERTLERLNRPRRVSVTGPAVAPDVEAVSLDLRMQEFLPEMMDFYRVPAVAVAVLDHGKPAMLKVFGHDAHGNAATRDTLFRVASLTKPITTMTVLRLVDQKLWNLDAPLSEFWTDPDIAGDARREKLTTRLALQHRTGFPNWRHGRLGFLTDPDVEWSYSGEGFEYLRRALEKKMGRNLEEFAREYVFKPAGMTDTSYIWNDTIEPRYAGEFYRIGEMLNYSRPTEPNAAAGLTTTIDDYARFAAWVMNGAALSSRTFREMITGHEGPPFGFSQGLGWIIARDKRGRMILDHGGSQTGMRMQVVLLPESGGGLVVLTNGSNGGPIIRAILNTTLNADGSLEVVDKMIPIWTRGGL